MLTEKSRSRNHNSPVFLHRDSRRIAVKGAPESDRRSQARITCDLQVVQTPHFGVRRCLDFLKVSFWIKWNDRIEHGFLDILEFMKKQVQETEDNVIPVFKECGFSWNLHRTGTSMYSYRISSGDVNLMFNKRKPDGQIPTCRMEIGSLSCWSPGFYSIYQRVKSFLAAYGGEIVKERVSEVHLAADFIGVDIKTLDVDNQEKWIARATCYNPHGKIPLDLGNEEDKEREANFSAHYKYRKFTGFDLGSGNLMLRVYDKVTELKRARSVHKQQIFAEIWGFRKFDEQDVTRVEYQIRRPRLREFTNDQKQKVDTVEDLLHSLKSLWQYLTSEWTRHTENPVNRNHNQGKATISEFWHKVQSVVWTGVFGLVRNHPVKHKDIGMLRKQARGILMSVCACLEVEPDDIDKIVYLCKELIEEDLHEFFEDQGAFIKKMQVKRNEAKNTLAG